MLETFIELADYVWDFYAPNSDLYPIKGLTMDEVYAAIYEYKQRLLKVSYNNPEYIKAFGNNYTYGYAEVRYGQCVLGSYTNGGANHV